MSKVFSSTELSRGEIFSRAEVDKSPDRASGSFAMARPGRSQCEHFVICERPPPNWSGQFLRDGFVKHFSHCERYDYAVLTAKESIHFAQRIGRKLERDEEAFCALLAHHGRLEGIYVWPSDLVLLLDLNRIPHVHKV